MSLPKFSPLNAKEQAWLREQLEAAVPFVKAFLPEGAEKPVTLELLDQTFAAWLQTSTTDTNEINSVLNIVGLQFGQFLVEGAGFEWTVASDRHGTEMAIRALPGQGDVLVYPANFVAKRWERRESNFLVSSFEAIKAQVAEVAKNVGKPNSTARRPWWKLW